MVPLLTICCITLGHYLQPFMIWSAGISLTFAIVVWALRAATPLAAFCGGMICFFVIVATAIWDRTAFHSGLAPLMALFVLTFLSTRAGKSRKEKAHLAESRRGRSASQILANLGVAGLLCSLPFELLLERLYPFLHPGISDEGGIFFTLTLTSVALVAALAEATADTVSSEIGQAFGGTPILLTNFRRVPPGTDGAVSLLGSAAGLFGAVSVAAISVWGLRLTWRHAVIGLTGGIVGWLFDSILGATVERKGWLGNDLVNFSSTAIAALAALGMLLILR
jgi:uncharacterized membrane protein